jgi:hypothetical protein
LLAEKCGFLGVVLKTVIGEMPKDKVNAYFYCRTQKRETRIRSQVKDVGLNSGSSERL